MVERKSKTETEIGARAKEVGTAATFYSDAEEKCYRLYVLYRYDWRGPFTLLRRRRHRLFRRSETAFHPFVICRSLFLFPFHRYILHKVLGGNHLNIISTYTPLTSISGHCYVHYWLFRFSD